LTRRSIVRGLASIARESSSMLSSSERRKTLKAFFAGTFRRSI
jgi:hypothetical protein